MWTFLYVFFLILLTISLKQESLSVDLHYYSIVLNSLVSTLHSISVKHTQCHIIFWSSMIHVYFYQTQDMVPLAFICESYFLNNIFFLILKQFLIKNTRFHTLPWFSMISDNFFRTQGVKYSLVRPGPEGKTKDRDMVSVITFPKLKMWLLQYLYTYVKYRCIVATIWPCPSYFFFKFSHQFIFSSS